MHKQSEWVSFDCVRQLNFNPEGLTIKLLLVGGFFLLTLTYILIAATVPIESHSLAFRLKQNDAHER